MRCEQQRLLGILHVCKFGDRNIFQLVSSVAVYNRERESSKILVALRSTYKLALGGNAAHKQES